MMTYELSKEHMADPCDVFYSYKGLSPQHRVSIQRGHPEKTNQQGPVKLQAACTKKTPSA